MKIALMFSLFVRCDIYGHLALVETQLHTCRSRSGNLGNIIWLIPFSDEFINCQLDKQSQWRFLDLDCAFTNSRATLYSSSVRSGICL